MVIINQKVYSGNNISISGNRVTIDGKDVTPADTLQVTIQVDANIENLSIDYCNSIMVNGNVGYLQSVSGDVNCGPVTQSVHTTSGDVECGNVGGEVKSTSGDINCENVQGSVKTMTGDIKYRK